MSYWSTDRRIARRLEKLRKQMGDMSIVKPEDMSDLQRQEFLDCLAEVIRLEREKSAHDGIIEALKDEQEETSGSSAD